MSTLQPSPPGPCPVASAHALLAESAAEERGAIFTRHEVVDFILDLVGYHADRPLHRERLLEPSFGEGDFLLPAIGRLIASCERDGVPLTGYALGGAICGVELHQTSFDRTSAAVRNRLIEAGAERKEAHDLVHAWLHQGDFLLKDQTFRFTHVVGNPPYVRQEAIPDALMDAYRARFSTIYDRADLYVPFIERSLELLADGGVLGFICADRWMKNRYGTKLRELVARDFHLRAYVDMVDTPAFHSNVIAYPAITVIARETGTVTRVARRPAVERETLSALAVELTSPIGQPERRLNGEGSAPIALPSLVPVRDVPNVAAGAEPWILKSFDDLALVRRLEERFPAIEATGCKVGIGVATGADKAFIGPYNELDVEEDRKLPLATTRDIETGTVRWRGKGVINPFDVDGKLVPLDRYPRLRAYLEARRDVIAGRHVAKKAPTRWYRTIDRIHPELASRPKLLIPDIKGDALIVREDGQLYPHHNLYFITSDEWDIGALQAVLRSGIARLFVGLYSTRMRGGYLRFQAQYLRRIRLPRWTDVPESVRRELIAAEACCDDRVRNEAVAHLYGLSADELTLIERPDEAIRAA